MLENINLTMKEHRPGPLKFRLQSSLLAQLSEL